ncbi:MAG TPA: DUF4129 domain-containing protein [Egicoccus sp.]|nr:DUF4129 domain-containing protein [Egicoccus sp.]HSK24534.1 DUF4129 domain-containing protein [Egicoccus sp.]
MGLTIAVAGPLQHDPARLRDTARDLLARPPFGTEDPGPVTDVLLRIRAWVAAALDAALGAVVGNQVLAWAVVGLATAVLVVLVSRWGRHLRREPGSRPTLSGPTRRSSGAWLTEADDHARAGAWDAAIRCAYAALVTQLAEQELLEDARGLTVGEIDRTVATAATQRAGSVAAAGRAFEDAWYGHRRADREGYERVLDALDGVRAGARP